MLDPDYIDKAGDMVAAAYTPVSYTHLDVYKRQMLDGWERSEGAQLEANVARSLMMPVKTVSQWAARMPAKRGRKTCK